MGVSYNTLVRRMSCCMSSQRNCNAYAVRSSRSPPCVYDASKFILLLLLLSLFVLSSMTGSDLFSSSFTLRLRLVSALTLELVLRYAFCIVFLALR